MTYFAVMAALVAASLGMFVFAKRTQRVFSLAPVGIAIAITVIASFLQVDRGEITVVKSFGVVQHGEVYNNGIHFIRPWLERQTFDTKVAQFDAAGDGTLSGPTKGGVPLEVFDVTFVYRLKPEFIPEVYEKVSNLGSLVSSAARSAGRDAMATFSWDEIAYGKKTEVAKLMQQRFGEQIASVLVQSGIPKDKADNVFIALPVLIRRVQPPARILSENAENAAADVLLQRQVKLTEVAKQVAERQKQEGTGIANMLAQLPQGVDTASIAEILNAVANKQNADAILLGVENRSINAIVIPTGNPVAVTAGK